MLEALLQTALTDALAPDHLEIENESHGHNVPKNSETHFRIVVVSDAFEGLGRVKRHQLVYKAADEALNRGVHALAMQCFTPAEWVSNPARLASPPCHGGMKKESK
jgi:stress-induced morphogen